MLTRTSAKDEARLTVEAARARVDAAERALGNFHLEHCVRSAAAGRWTLLCEPGGMRDGLEREYHCLLVEADAASRHLRKSLEDYAEVVAPGSARS
jgi:hypothetical protein